MAILATSQDQRPAIHKKSCISALGCDMRNVERELHIREFVNKSRSTQRPQRRNAQGFLSVLCERCVQTSHFFNGSDDGFSLLETVIATGIMATALVALGQMVAISVANNMSARTGTYAAVLAQQKMEQLRGLMWGYDALALPLGDASTNTALPTESPTGGTGLTPSPPNALTSNIAGYVDYVDRFGNVIGGGATTPAKTVYIRRWSIEPLPSNPGNALILQVLVSKRVDPGASDRAGSTIRLRDEARLTTVKTRKAQ
jgi:type II secretory pathway pseudopilin PulG